MSRQHVMAGQQKNSNGFRNRVQFSLLRLESKVSLSRYSPSSRKMHEVLHLGKAARSSSRYLSTSRPITAYQELPVSLMESALDSMKRSSDTSLANHWS